MNTKWIDADMAQRRVREVERERDALRTEVAHWQGVVADANDHWGKECERLRATQATWRNQANIEIDRLRAALETIALTAKLDIYEARDVAAKALASDKPR